MVYKQLADAIQRGVEMGVTYEHMARMILSCQIRLDANQLDLLFRDQENVELVQNAASLDTRKPAHGEIGAIIKMAFNLKWTTRQLVEDLLNRGLEFNEHSVKSQYYTLRSRQKKFGVTETVGLLPRGEMPRLARAAVARGLTPRQFLDELNAKGVQFDEKRARVSFSNAKKGVGNVVRTVRPGTTSQLARDAVSRNLTQAQFIDELRNSELRYHELTARAAFKLEEDKKNKPDWKPPVRGIQYLQLDFLREAVTAGKMLKEVIDALTPEQRDQYNISSLKSAYHRIKKEVNNG